MAWVARLPELAKRLRIVGNRLERRKPDGGATLCPRDEPMK